MYIKFMAMILLLGVYESAFSRGIDITCNNALKFECVYKVRNGIAQSLTAEVGCSFQPFKGGCMLSGGITPEEYLKDNSVCQAAIARKKNLSFEDFIVISSKKVSGCN